MVVAFSGSGSIVWFKNIGGESFQVQPVISSNTAQARGVFAGDLDNDGDIDVASAAFDDNKVSWFPNLGNGEFGTERIITSSANGVFQVFIADLDLDGDTGALCAFVQPKNSILNPMQHRCAERLVKRQQYSMVSERWRRLIHDGNSNFLQCQIREIGLCKNRFGFLMFWAFLAEFFCGGGWVGYRS